MLYPLRGYRRLVRFDASSQVYDKAYSEMTRIGKELTEAQHMQVAAKKDLERLASDMRRAGASPAVVGGIVDTAKAIDKHTGNALGCGMAFSSTQRTIGAYRTRVREKTSLVGHGDLPGGGTPGRSPYNNGRLG